MFSADSMAEFHDCLLVETEASLLATETADTANCCLLQRVPPSWVTVRFGLNIIIAIGGLVSTLNIQCIPYHATFCAVQCNEDCTQDHVFHKVFIGSNPFKR